MAKKISVNNPAITISIILVILMAHSITQIKNFKGRIIGLKKNLSAGMGSFNANNIGITKPNINQIGRIAAFDPGERGFFSRYALRKERKQKQTMMIATQNKSFRVTFISAQFSL